MHVDVVCRRRQVVDDDLNVGCVLGDVDHWRVVGAARAFGVQQRRLRSPRRPMKGRFMFCLR